MLSALWGTLHPSPSAKIASYGAMIAIASCRRRESTTLNKRRPPGVVTLCSFIPLCHGSLQRRAANPGQLRRAGKHLGIPSAVQKVQDASKTDSVAAVDGMPAMV